MPLPPLSDEMPRWQLYAIPMGLVAIAGPWSAQVMILGSIAIMAWADSR